jgi:hypothetical protein
MADPAMDPTSDSFVARLREREAWYAGPRQSWSPWVPAAGAIAVVALVAIAAVNVAVNPRADFGHRWYPPLVGDDPLEKLLAFEALEVPPERLVLGSSRAGMIPPSNTTVKGYNFAIPGGGLRDSALVYDYVANHGGPPEHVILGLDSFQMSAKDLRDVAIHRSKAAPRLTGEGSSVRETAALVVGTLTPAYAADTLRSLGYAHLNGYPERSRITAEDGVQVWTIVDRERTAGTYDQAAKVDENWRQGLEGRYGPEDVPDVQAIAVAEALIQRMVADGAQVQVVLLPFHPGIRDRLGATVTFGPLQQAALDVAMRSCPLGIEVYDYTDPALIGIQPDQFYDAIHLAPDASATVAAALEAHRGGLCEVQG